MRRIFRSTTARATRGLRHRPSRTDNIAARRRTKLALHMKMLVTDMGLGELEVTNPGTPGHGSHLERIIIGIDRGNNHTENYQVVELRIRENMTSEGIYQVLKILHPLVRVRSPGNAEEAPREPALARRKMTVGLKSLWEVHREVRSEMCQQKRGHNGWSERSRRCRARKQLVLGEASGEDR